MKFIKQNSVYIIFFAIFSGVALCGVAQRAASAHAPVAHKAQSTALTPTPKPLIVPWSASSQPTKSTEFELTHFKTGTKVTIRYITNVTAQNKDFAPPKESKKQKATATKEDVQSDIVAFDLYQGRTQINNATNVVLPTNPQVRSKMQGQPGVLCDGCVLTIPHTTQTANCYFKAHGTQSFYPQGGYFQLTPVS